MKIAAIMTAHREGIIAGPSIASLHEAAADATSAGFTLEKIVVLDRPDTLTRTVIESFADMWDAVIVTDSGDPGLARNAGVAAASSDYVTFLDADDLWSANWITDAGRMADKLDRATILHSDFNLIFGAGHDVWIHTDSSDETFDKGYLLLSNYWDALCFCYRNHLP